MKEAVREKIGKMLEGGIIESTQLPYTNPVVAIKKKNGSVQMCLDFSGDKQVWKMTELHPEK